MADGTCLESMQMPVRIILRKHATCLRCVWSNFLAFPSCSYRPRPLPKPLDTATAIGASFDNTCEVDPRSFYPWDTGTGELQASALALNWQVQSFTGLEESSGIVGMSV